jgi:pimeloyl-ACP methyl ester carboxylesterase
LASSPIERSFTSFDGVRIGWTELGEGRPLVLLHGLFSNAHVNWLKFGTAERVAKVGRRLIMPDVRAHGLSEAPRDASAYPPDVLVTDTLALIDHLALDDYDLGGYSLGGRQTIRAILRGAAPKRIAVIGMGLGSILDADKSSDWFIDAIARADAHARGSEAWFAIQFMETNKVDPIAATHVLKAQVDTPLANIRSIRNEALVLCGKDDHYNAAAHELARTLPSAQWREIPGNHMSSVTKPDLGEALAEFFAA